MFCALGSLACGGGYGRGRRGGGRRVLRALRAARTTGAAGASAAGSSRAAATRCGRGIFACVRDEFAAGCRRLFRRIGCVRLVLLPMCRAMKSFATPSLSGFLRCATGAALSPWETWRLCRLVDLFGFPGLSGVLRAFARLDRLLRTIDVLRLLPPARTGLQPDLVTAGIDGHDGRQHRLQRSQPGRQLPLLYRRELLHPVLGARRSTGRAVETTRAPHAACASAYSARPCRMRARRSARQRRS